MSRPAAIIVFAQRGQALVEALVVCLALLMLWAGSTWLARLQNMALQTGHSAAFSAFAASRSWAVPAGTVRAPHFFHGASHGWRDLAGGRLLGSPGQLREVFRDEAVLPVTVQAGKLPESVALARELHIFHDGMHVAQVQVQGGRAGPEDSRFMPPPRPMATGVRTFLGPSPVIQRHVAIIGGAGHAATDHTAALRLGSSALAWKAARTLSGGAAERVNAAVAAADAAWGRAALQTDWLVPWREHIPAEHLQTQPSSD